MSAALIGEMSDAPVLTVQADVAEPADCERIVAATAERFGAADILVNNAARFALVPLVDADADEALRFLTVNVAGPLHCARAFAAHAFAEGRRGAIVNVSSIAGARPAPGCGLYSASKAALDMLTRSMALEWGPKGIRVNAVAPGHVATEGVLEDFQAGRLDEARLVAAIPARRIADVDDIADAVLFLCSDKARHVMGHVLTVDGGEGF
jgi:NAD(P)-dependent dehydrogenase (short-subunit alcohol dehydrogenase family)